MQQALVDYDNGVSASTELVDAFKKHMIHDVLATVATMRPSVDISLSE